jgi:hypothetical protein
MPAAVPVFDLLGTMPAAPPTCEPVPAPTLTAGFRRG